MTKGLTCKKQGLMRLLTGSVQSTKWLSVTEKVRVPLQSCPPWPCRQAALLIALSLRRERNRLWSSHRVQQCCWHGYTPPAALSPQSTQTDEPVQQQRQRHYHCNHKLECGSNMMAALSNIGGNLCSMPQSLADAQYWSAVQQSCQDAKPVEICRGASNYWINLSR